MRNKVIIKMPIGATEIQCEIAEYVWGCQKQCSKLLSKLLTSYYDYPIKVTVETDKEELKAWRDYDAK
jgi:hypothetical protein